MLDRNPSVLNVGKTNFPRAEGLYWLKSQHHRMELCYLMQDKVMAQAQVPRFKALVFIYASEFGIF